MRREFAVALLLLLSVPFAAAQPPAPPAPTLVRHVFYYSAPGVTAPELLSATSTDTALGPCEKVEGIAVLSAIVDTEGVARRIQFTRRPGKKLDDIAINIVKADRFKPGAYNGAPSAVAVLIEVDLSACKEKKKEGTGKEISALQLVSAPTQTVEVLPAPGMDSIRTVDRSIKLPSVIPAPPKGSNGANISAPAVLHHVEPEYTDAAKKAKITGTCLVSLVVDANGMPQDVQVVRSFVPRLDERAVEAIQQYRFKPAMKDGKTPVPVTITIEVDFRLF